MRHSRRTIPAGRRHARWAGPWAAWGCSTAGRSVAGSADTSAEQRDAEWADAWAAQSVAAWAENWVVGWAGRSVARSVVSSVESWGGALVFQSAVSWVERKAAPSEAHSWG